MGTKVIVVRSKAEWEASPHFDEKRYQGLPVVEDPDLPPRTYSVIEEDTDV